MSTRLSLFSPGNAAKETSGTLIFNSYGLGILNREDANSVVGRDSGKTFAVIL